ncbi:MAG: Retron-type reverse transcriptase [Gammaproteobacteria bacterium]|nr:MAG: Retron-type reverse transcriptase [Gammaproteobacteria bacterium]
MGKLFERMLSPEILDRAWRRLRGDQTVWAPGIPRQEMERQAIKHILRLVEEVRAGDYRPAGLRRFAVAKPSGGRRVLSALTLRDKLLQTAAMLVLTPSMERLFHPDSYAYRPRRNVDMAFAKSCERIRCGLDWLVDADIRSFFDEIPHRNLVKRLRRHIPDDDLCRLMEQWLDVGYAQTHLFALRRGIPQGAVLSPLWCNLYLHQLDMAWHRKNVPFVRFADDFLLFAPDRRGAERAMEWTRKQLAKLELALHPEKTRITRSGPHVIFLGRPLPKVERHV